MRAAWLLALATSGALADGVQVVSPRADSVSVTIYRDLFALITETRTVDLPAGPVTLVFDGVVSTLLPQSAVVTGVGRHVGESNYDFERLTPANLLKHSIGKTVLLTRTNPATGRVRQVPATVVAANPRGVVFETRDGTEALRCAGLPEKLTLDAVPSELKPQPALSIRLAAGEAGRREVRVSYLAHGFGWQADYVGTLSADGPHLELLGWISLVNATDTTFRNARVQVIAGRLNLLDAQYDRGTAPLGPTDEFWPDLDFEELRDDALADLRAQFDEEPDDVEYFSGCYPLGAQWSSPIQARVDVISAEDVGRFPDGDHLDEVIVTGLRGSLAARENLADYQLYRLPEATDLAARQTKQVAFLHKPAVKFERFYSMRLPDSVDFEIDPDDPPIPEVRIGWVNRASDGLGEPLPAGIVRMFEQGAAGLVMTGDDRIIDTAAGAPVELTLGKATDLAFHIDNLAELTDDPPPAGLLSLLTRRVYLPLHLRVASGKPVPVSFELRQRPISEIEDFRVTGASLPASRKAGDYVWRFTVPARGEATLSYRIGGRIPRDR